MIRRDWKNIQPIKFILNLLGKRKKKTQLETPWQMELENLANRYNKDPMSGTTYELVGECAGSECEDPLQKLCNEVKEDMEMNDRIVVRKVDKRTNDTTATDLKAWWGQAVATWDPVNAKNVDSIDQQRRPRKSKWFDKV